MVKGKEIIPGGHIVAKDQKITSGRWKESAKMSSDRLTEDSLVDASKIEIWIKDNDLVLSGTVETKFEKRRAEHLAESVPGAKHVQNNLRVAGNENNVPHTFG